jgi:hypothetical protein
MRSFFDLASSMTNFWCDQISLNIFFLQIKGTSETITKLASCAVEKNEQNLTELRKLLVSLLSDATHLGLKDEILSSFLTEEEYFACRPGKKRKRKHDPQSEKSTEALVCRVCGATETSEWRRGPDGAKSLCNACGLHYSKILRKERSYFARGGNATSSSVANPAKINSILNPPLDSSAQNDPLHTLADLVGRYSSSPTSSTPSSPTTSATSATPKPSTATAHTRMPPLSQAPPLFPLTCVSPTPFATEKTPFSSMWTSRPVACVPPLISPRSIQIPLFANKTLSLATTASLFTEPHRLPTKLVASLQNATPTAKNVANDTNDFLCRNVKCEKKQ